MARLLALILVAAAAACGGGEEEKIAEARSWSATAMLVGQHWVRGEVPSAYARDALKKAAAQLAQGAFPDAAGPVSELELAVARGDREEAKRILEDLAR